GINTFDVLEAAGTKWNFLKFFPGLVGGHCIGVDPYYLTYKAQEIGYHSKVILSGRQINDSMGAYVAKETIKHIISTDKSLKQSNVLIMGATFKENVTDIRNSKVVDIYNELKSFSINIDVVDPYADSEELMHEYGFELAKDTNKKYDAVIVAVSHTPYIGLDKNYFNNLLQPNGLLVDIKGIYRNKLADINYWSL
ncbi:MAG TPA: UDP binding domain-containing protein, partial [Bacteroidia bacterium]|nr:UDP binding domain-containing protein [Bacteroidia bacterium]